MSYQGISVFNAFTGADISSPATAPAVPTAVFTTDPAVPTAPLTTPLTSSKPVVTVSLAALTVYQYAKPAIAITSATTANMVFGDDAEAVCQLLENAVAACAPGCIDMALISLLRKNRK